MFEKWKKRREEKRQLKELSTLASAFHTLDTMEQKGIIQWDQKQRRLFIESSLATLMLRNAKSWQAFINNCFLWLYYREQQQLTNDYFLREELEAVRKVKQARQKGGKSKVLSRKDIMRIREARRQEILQSDIPTQKVEPFEFFIIKAGVPADIISVGHYDPETEKMELALWKDIII